MTDTGQEVRCSNCVYSAWNTVGTPRTVFHMTDIPYEIFPQIPLYKCSSSEYKEKTNQSITSKVQNKSQSASVPSWPRFLF